MQTVTSMGFTAHGGSRVFPKSKVHIPTESGLAYTRGLRKTGRFTLLTSIHRISNYRMYGRAGSCDEWGG
jgi:hypothetical protein